MPYEEWDSQEARESNGGCLLSTCLVLCLKLIKATDNVYFVVGLFSRYAEGYALSAEEKTMQRCANVSSCAVSVFSPAGNSYVPKWGCPHTFLSDKGVKFTAEVSKDVYTMQGATKKLRARISPKRMVRWSG